MGEYLEVLYSDKEKVLSQMRRRLIKNFIDIIILSRLKETPMSGYDVISLIYKRFHILLGSGSIYSLLYSMERKGLIRGVWDERRRIYKLTSRGEETIKAALDSYERIKSFMTKLFAKTPI